MKNVKFELTGVEFELTAPLVVKEVNTGKVKESTGAMQEVKESVRPIFPGLHLFASTLKSGSSRAAAMRVPLIVSVTRFLMDDLGLLGLVFYLWCNELFIKKYKTNIKNESQRSIISSSASYPFSGCRLCHQLF